MQTNALLRPDVPNTRSTPSQTAPIAPSKASSVSEHRYKSPSWNLGLSSSVPVTFNAGLTSSFPFMANFASAWSHITFSSSIHFNPCTFVTAGEVRETDRVVLWIRNGKSAIDCEVRFGCGGNFPSACLPPSRTYAAATPRMLASRRSGRSTMLFRDAFEVLGLEYR